MNQSEKIRIISTETIKPSSPTPPHLTNFKLSLVDNYTAAAGYTPLVFFYPAHGSKTGQERLHVLKSSLAQALTRFYPLAGRLSRLNQQPAADSVPLMFIHCSDEGVPFSTADGGGIGSSMALFLARGPDADSLEQFLPFPAGLLLTTAAIESAPLFAARATLFPCGGIAVGVCGTHKIMDAHTSADFVKFWGAAACRQGSEVGGAAYAHDRAAASLFPLSPEDVGPPAVNFGCEEGQKKMVTRRFVFDGEAISALKSGARSDRVSNPTRSEVVFGFIWKSAVNATAKAVTSTGGGEAVYSVGGMLVDLRPRMKEPWLDYSVGNIFWANPTVYKYDSKQRSDEAKTLQQLVGELRSSVSKVDDKLMEKLEGGDGREEFFRNQQSWLMALMPTGVAESDSTVMTFWMSSMVGIGFYDVDFGWGKPVWVGMTGFANQMFNRVMLMESPIGHGIEAWVTLHEHEMTIMEHDPRFLAFANNNPSVSWACPSRL
ncbi:unnamed protein product [Linum tenue]|uniref:Uncharacterized protein n=1 Tax=Linum tenue TaxID=586396 RepID=A0AAV0MCH7_9ROSI|nr:unnamed protein product [Linum tenue]